MTIRCSDEALRITEDHLDGDSDYVLGVIPVGMDTLSRSMDRVFNIFLIEDDATFAAENDLDPLYLPNSTMSSVMVLSFH